MLINNKHLALDGDSVHTCRAGAHQPRRAGLVAELPWAHCCPEPASDELEPKWVTISLFFLTVPQCFYASWPPSPKAGSHLLLAVYLIFRTMFLWTSFLLALQPFLSCRFYFSHMFSCALFVQLYHNSPFAPVWLCIIYVLNLTVLQMLPICCWLCFLQVFNVKGCSCAGASCAGVMQSPSVEVEGRHSASGIQQPLLWLCCFRTKGNFKKISLKCNF